MTKVEQKAEEYIQGIEGDDCVILKDRAERKKAYIDGYHEGFKDCAKSRLNVTTISDCPIKDEWHDLEKDPTDLPKGDEYSLKGIHRKILLQDRYGNIYTGNYYPKDQCHRADCFAVEFLDWGLQGSNFCAKEQISKWKEIE